MLLGNDPARAFMPYPAVAVEGAAAGPLQSLTFGVKDLYDVAGYRTACGNPVKLAESPVAAISAPPVQALLDAGALFVGKTHTEELAWSLYGTNAHFGTPLNPAAPDRQRAGRVVVGVCERGGGAVVRHRARPRHRRLRARPRACGLYGLRPTHGAISLARCMLLAPSFDTCGFFARDALT